MVNVKCFNDNMNELHGIESKRKAIRKGFAFELMNAQDAVLCSRLHASHAGPTSTPAAPKSGVRGMLISVCAR